MVGHDRHSDAVHLLGYRNAVLGTLPAEAIARLGLHKVQFELMHEIEFPGTAVERLYFVEEGMASMTVTFHDGSQVEVGMFGYESLIGVSALMGTKKSLNRVYTQIPGWGYACSIENARREFALGGVFQELALRYVQAQLVQTAQCAACNAKHEVEQRLARWLLICADRAHKNTFKMPHEFLADMLGVSRPTVSAVARGLKNDGLLDYTRKVLTIPDPAKLEARACECYRAITDYLDNYTQYDSGLAA